MSQAAFISIDGLDGTGKSTQCRLLADYLVAQNVPTVPCRDPGSTRLGGELRQLLLHRQEVPISLPAEALLFLAARAQLVAEVIRPAWERGQVIVCDRFALATVVYQGEAAGLDPAQLWELNRFATGGCEPDLTVVLDLEDPQLGLRRKSSWQDRFEGRDGEYLRRVRDGFRRQVRLHPERMVLVDAAAPPQEVQRAIRGHVVPLLRQRGWSLPDELD